MTEILKAKLRASTASIKTTVQNENSKKMENELAFKVILLKPNPTIFKSKNEKTLSKKIYLLCKCLNRRKQLLICRYLIL